MEPDAAPCLHAFDYHPVCYFIYNFTIMHLTIILCPTSSSTSLSCIWLWSYVVQHYDLAFDYHALCPSPSTTSSTLTLCLKKIVAYNSWMMFLLRKRLLPTSGSCFCLAMMTSQVLEFYSIFSAHYQHYTALYWSAPQPSCCWTFWKSDGDPNKARLVQALGNTLFCAYQLLLNSTQRSRPHLLQPVRAHHHWEQGQLAILTFASIVYSHSHWQPNFDADFFW